MPHRPSPILASAGFRAVDIYKTRAFQNKKHATNDSDSPENPAFMRIRGDDM